MATETPLGTRIRRARERKRMSQQQLADQLGVSRGAVNAWENDRATPASSIGAIEEVLDVDLSDRPAAATDDAAIEALEQEAAALLEAAKRMRAARARRTERKTDDEDVGRRRRAI